MLRPLPGGRCHHPHTPLANTAEHQDLLRNHPDMPKDDLSGHTPIVEAE